MYRHKETSNESFLKYAEILEHFGVENHSFCLNLINEDLKNVNPFDPDLTDEQKKAITEEAKNNPWYYFREIVRVPVHGRDEAVPFEAKDLWMSAMYSVFQGKDHYMFAPRQRGRSLTSDLLSAYIGGFLGYRTATIVTTSKMTEYSYERICKLIDLQPKYLYENTGFSWKVHIDTDAVYESSEMDNFVHSCMFNNFNHGGFSVAYIQNGKADLIYKGYLEDGLDFISLEDVQYQRVVNDTLNFIAQADRDTVRRKGTKRFGNLYTVPMENESRTKSTWHQLLSMTSGAGYWDRSFYEDRIQFNATWRMEPFTDDDIKRLAYFC